MSGEPTIPGPPIAERLISRRSMIGGTAAGTAVIALGSLAVLTQRNLAAAQGEATPGANQVAGTPQPPASPGASPAGDLPAVPPEVTQFSNDWPLA